MQQMFRFRKGLMVALVCTQVVLFSCGKNPTEADNPKPALPPTNSMSVDLSTFQGNLPKTGAIGRNFLTAQLTVATINLAVLVHMSVPVLTFAAAASQTPVLKDDAKWHWIYSVSQSGQQFQADLAGWIDEDARAVRWEMRITTNAGGLQLNRFLWYTGRAELNNVSGEWTIYDHTQPNASVAVVNITWNYESAASKGSLQFTVVKPGVPENGDTLTYTSNGSQRSVEYFDKSENTRLTIAWDAVTRAGYIIAPNYNNGQKACWDSQLNDTVCP
ncbi:MAG: hypothetical protein ONB48_10705 [candidate division KSB1 bacterium]|nr:hypothetical protein [candidate division KSB1 bacterium]MDZ7273958.1 hypothetical protein [candidate division KSB1 bacterium]MDZ7286114.1 hypothetical protein [candidate division KSB1 bacterium]MDZ7299146.1 hypothetical protein [candidate division KSB1 bacterium]MDZ7308343.1 hypothetical protein [candidate division KSB1 bacterium]